MKQSLRHPTPPLQRCEWATADPVLVEYHDTEWGIPEHDDRKLFELLVLEGAQAGLSWLTVLKKRENYRRAFERFDPERVAAFDSRKVRTLLADEGIIRNRLKFAAAIQDAKAFLAVQEEFRTFDAYVWRFVGGQPRRNRWKPEAAPRKDKGVGHDESGSEETRVHVRGIDDLLCLHAGGWDGQ